MKSIFRIIFIIVPVIFLTIRNTDAQNELDVIRNSWLEYSDATNFLYHHLTSQAYNMIWDGIRAVDYLLTTKEMAPVLLHAAAFESNIKNIVLIEPYSSYKAIVMNRFYDPYFILSTVPGALKKYDLPDLAGMLAPRNLFISGITDGNGSSTDTISINKDVSIIKAAYHSGKADERLTILTGVPDIVAFEKLLEWITKE